jgi:hypothetical protein
MYNTKTRAPQQKKRRRQIEKETPTVQKAARAI